MIQLERRFTEAERVKWKLGLILLCLGCSAAPKATRDVAGDVGGRTWPNAQIFFQISTQFSRDQALQIKQAIQLWSDDTPLTFIEQASSAGYILFELYSDLEPVAGHSELGFQGRRQIIALQNQQYGLGDVVHEIGHAIGLVHEHQRPDREQYISIDSREVEPQYRFAFKIEGRPVGNYDYDSVMHYPANAFGIHKEVTITGSKQPVDANKSDRPSIGDKLAVCYLYCSRSEYQARVAEIGGSNAQNLLLLIDP